MFCVFCCFFVVFVVFCCFFVVFVVFCCLYMIFHFIMTDSAIASTGNEGFDYLIGSILSFMTNINDRVDSLYEQFEGLNDQVVTLRSLLENAVGGGVGNAFTNCMNNC